MAADKGEGDWNILTITTMNLHSDLGLLGIEENSPPIYGLFKDLFSILVLQFSFGHFTELKDRKTTQDISKIYHFQVLTVKSKTEWFVSLYSYLGQIKEKDRECIFWVSISYTLFYSYNTL